MTMPLGAAEKLEQVADDLPNNAKNAFDNYSDNNWQGNFQGKTPGTSTGGIYRNSNALLPSMDGFGNTITYRQFDINNKLAGMVRDTERFVIGSGGSVYYTYDHYTTFIRIN